MNEGHEQEADEGIPRQWWVERQKDEIARKLGVLILWYRYVLEKFVTASSHHILLFVITIDLRRGWLSSPVELSRILSSSLSPFRWRCNAQQSSIFSVQRRNSSCLAFSIFSSLPVKFTPYMLEPTIKFFRSRATPVQASLLLFLHLISDSRDLHCRARISILSVFVLLI
jgi:hypothetical protein